MSLSQRVEDFQSFIMNGDTEPLKWINTSANNVPGNSNCLRATHANLCLMRDMTLTALSKIDTSTSGEIEVKIDTLFILFSKLDSIVGTAQFNHSDNFEYCGTLNSEQFDIHSELSEPIFALLADLHVIMQKSLRSLVEHYAVNHIIADKQKFKTIAKTLRNFENLNEDEVRWAIEGEYNSDESFEFFDLEQLASDFMADVNRFRIMSGPANLANIIAAS